MLLHVTACLWEVVSIQPACETHLPPRSWQSPPLKLHWQNLCSISAASTMNAFVLSDAEKQSTAATLFRGAHLTFTVNYSITARFQDELKQSDVLFSPWKLPFPLWNSKILLFWITIGWFSTSLQNRNAEKWVWQRQTGRGSKSTARRGWIWKRWSLKQRRTSRKKLLHNVSLTQKWKSDVCAVSPRCSCLVLCHLCKPEHREQKKTSWFAFNRKSISDANLTRRLNKDQGDRKRMKRDFLYAEDNVDRHLFWFSLIWLDKRL